MNKPLRLSGLPGGLFQWRETEKDLQALTVTYHSSVPTSDLCISASMSLSLSQSEHDITSTIRYPPKYGQASFFELPWTERLN